MSTYLCLHEPVSKPVHSTISIHWNGKLIQNAALFYFNMLYVSLFGNLSLVREHMQATKTQEDQRWQDCKSQNLRAMPDNNMQFRTMPENNRSGDNNSVVVQHSSLEHIFLNWSVTICLGKAGEKMQLLFCHCQNKSCFAVQLTLESLQYLQILKKTVSLDIKCGYWISDILK